MIAVGLDSVFVVLLVLVSVVLILGLDRASILIVLLLLIELLLGLVAVIN